MVKKSSEPPAPAAKSPDSRKKGCSAVYAVAADPEHYQRVKRECARFPGTVERVTDLSLLARALSAGERVSVVFVLLVAADGRALDTPGLRRIRLDFPQIVFIALLGTCDQQCELRLQSIGVNAILLPPYDDIDVEGEISTAIPNVPQFKRHPALMRCGQVRLDFLVPSDLSYVLGVNFEVSLLLKEFGFPPQDTRINIPLACDEAITNAIVHGNGTDPAKKVNIQIYLSHSRFKMRVRDQGSGFDLGAVDDPREGDNIHRPSGRGIFLMRKIMDVVEYKEGGRVLELEKRNPAVDPPSNDGR